jgi:thioredoxin 1
MAVTFNDATFQAEALDFKGVVVIDFWATWCGPCRIQGPIIDALAQKFSGNTQLKIGKLDVDENSDTAAKYQVLSIPTLIFLKDGQVVDTLVGLRSEADVEAKINSYLNS